ncbi:hypothetical protein HZP43_15665 [Elizabethkingia anophelis]|nr:hypothetical protein [Elizabethkingia anophelis]MCT4223792.1 hypothetical protein [Elizabethkingia anophelis]MDV2463420.1 hypothetical protein [Elizabethkingia anophelis]MDV3477512.1 hypothetical protein [Elizabethkingia anophelis]MDV3996040.1 hypothetical protein [Elizabethkingia anophelis]
MKKKLLIITLLFFSLFLFVACISDRDHSNKEAELSQKKDLSILSAAKVNGKYVVQVKIGTIIKTYDTLVYNDSYIYNNGGALNIIDKNTSKSNKSATSQTSAYSAPNTRWYIDTNNYINDNTGFRGCPFEMVKSEMAAFLPRFVSHLYSEEGNEMGDLFWYHPLDGYLTKGPFYYYSSNTDLNEYLQCWADTDPMQVIVPYNP